MAKRNGCSRRSGKTQRFEEICSELKRLDTKTRYQTHYEKAFRTIAQMSKAEEACTLAQAKDAVAHWWDSSNTILDDKDVAHTCLAAFPLHALKVKYNKEKKGK